MYTMDMYACGLGLLIGHYCNLLLFKDTDGHDFCSNLKTQLRHVALIIRIMNGTHVAVPTYTMDMLPCLGHNGLAPTWLGHNGPMLQCLGHNGHVAVSWIWLHSTHVMFMLYAAFICIIPSVTTRVKISQNVDILPKVYLVHLKVEHCQTLCVVSTFTGQNEPTIFFLFKMYLRTS